MYFIAFYVPEEHSEKVKNAMFQAGAGRIGNYDCCAWETRGTGQFRPLEGSSPFSGEKGKISKDVELKVEMVCDDLYIKDVIKAMKEAHPYEEVAYHFFKINEF